MLAIIDYGIGNVRSIQNAFEYLGYDAILTRDQKEIELADGVIFPGVGAFGEGKRRIEEYNLLPVLQSIFDKQKPVLGICLGFQLLMHSSSELGYHSGLNFFPFNVVRLPVNERLPHIGWAPVYAVNTDSSKNIKIMTGLDGEQFYFVHSYGVVESALNFSHAIVNYGDCEIIAAIEHENIVGTQFHPEKSGEAGLHLLRNFVETIK